MRNLKFTDATPEQFKEFWEGEGWEVIWPMPYGKALRKTKTGFFLSIVFEISIGTSQVPLPETFGEAADALNELANTRIMGGWA